MKERELSSLIKKYKKRKDSDHNKALKFDREVGIITILIGTSILTSFFLTNYLSNNYEILTRIYDIEKDTILYSIIGSIMILEGIIFYKNSFKESFFNHKESKKFFSKSEFKRITSLIFRVIIFSLFPYLIVLSFGLEILLWPNDYIELYEGVLHPTIAINSVPIFAIFFEISRLIKSLTIIFKQTVKDSKDRLSIVITIVATIVSTIALLK